CTGPVVGPDSATPGGRRQAANPGAHRGDRTHDPPLGPASENRRPAAKAPFLDRLAGLSPRSLLSPRFAKFDRLPTAWSIRSRAWSSRSTPPGAVLGYTSTRPAKASSA